MKTNFGHLYGVDIIKFFSTNFVDANEEQSQSGTTAN